MTIDPRAENCRKFAQDASGRVTGVELTYFPRENTRYALRSVILIGEEEAQGKIVARVWVEDKNGMKVIGRVGMSWSGVEGKPDGTPNVAWPGGTNMLPVEHIISNGYNPPAHGPLAIAVYDDNGLIVSDVIDGLGLPGNRHVCYELIFRERSATSLPTSPPAETDRQILLRIEQKLDVLLAR